jgi:hypothetical protein
MYNIKQNYCSVALVIIKTASSKNLSISAVVEWICNKTVGDKRSLVEVIATQR